MHPAGFLHVQGSSRRATSSSGRQPGWENSFSAICPSGEEDEFLLCMYHSAPNPLMVFSSREQPLKPAVCCTGSTLHMRLAKGSSVSRTLFWSFPGRGNYSLAMQTYVPYWVGVISCVPGGCRAERLVYLRA